MRKKSEKFMDIIAMVMLSFSSYGADGDASTNTIEEGNTHPPKPNINGRPRPPLFAELDLDSNGSVTFSEFQQHPIPHGDHETGFSHIDSNEDGVITKQEWLDHRPPGPPPSQRNQSQQ